MGAQGPVGPAGPQGATGLPGTTGQSYATVYGTASVTASFSFAPLPGLTQTVTVAAGQTLYIATDGAILSNATSATGFSIVDVALVIDGALAPAGGGYKRVVSANTAGITSNMITNYSMALSLSLAAGSHTIQVETILSAGSSAIVSAGPGSVLQGELSVLLLNN